MTPRRDQLNRHQSQLFGRAARTLALLLGMLGHGHHAAAQEAPRNSVAVVSTFQELESRNRQWFLSTDSLQNLSGGYAWAGSVLLEAELDAYEATEDTAWLFRFVDIADRIVRQRDDSIGRVDWRGSLGAGWGESRKWVPGLGNTDDGVIVRYLVDDAVIAAPLARFAHIVTRAQDGVMSTRLQRTAVTFARFAREVANYHIRRGWNRHTGHFHSERGSPIWWDGVNVPRNHEAAAARLLIFLDQVDGNSTYAAIIQRVVQHFTLAFQEHQGAYVWSYWGGIGYDGWRESDSISTNTPSSLGQQTVEDVRHGAIDIAFVMAAWRYGYGFSRSDIGHLLATLRRSLPAGRQGAATVDGMGRSRLPAEWLGLASLDCSLHSMLVARYLPLDRGDYRTVLTLAQMLRTPPCTNWNS